MSRRNVPAALPVITPDSTFGDCLLALMKTKPTPEEEIFARAQMSGSPVSAFRAARAAEMKTRQDVGLRLASKRRDKRAA